MNVAEATNIASDIITAATALAGLLLVFLGNAVADFQRIDAERQSRWKFKYRQKAWLAFGGFALALVAAILAVVGKLWSDADLIALGTIFMFGAIATTAISGFITATEIK